MKLEVEQKYPVGDQAALEARFAALGAEVGRPYLQVDEYFAHPTRDFGQTDEALRIRRMGDENFLTYKGPKLGTVGKARRELEFAFARGGASAELAKELLLAVGFRPVAEVCKVRRVAALAWQGRLIAAALDEVAGLGTFVELEVLAEESDREACQRSLSELAAELNLLGSERRSYLELLLERSGDKS